MSLPSKAVRSFLLLCACAMSAFLPACNHRSRIQPQTQPVPAPPAALVQKSFALPGDGRLELAVPSDWKESVSQPPGESSSIIQFLPAEGNGFGIALRPILPREKEISMAQVQQ